MGLEGSLQHIQEPAIFRCPEADEWSLHQLYFFKILFNVMLLPTHRFSKLMLKFKAAFVWKNTFFRAYHGISNAGV